MNPADFLISIMEKNQKNEAFYHLYISKSQKEIEPEVAKLVKERSVLEV